MPLKDYLAALAEWRNAIADYETALQQCRNSQTPECRAKVLQARENLHAASQNLEAISIDPENPH